MINRYKDIFNKINNKILYVISFDSIKELYPLLSSVVYSKEAAMYTYWAQSEYSDIDLIRKVTLYNVPDINLIRQVTLYNLNEAIQIDFEARCSFYLRKRYRDKRVKFYTNKERSMFVLVANYDNNMRVVYIIK